MCMWYMYVYMVVCTSQHVWGARSQYGWLPLLLLTWLFETRPLHWSWNLVIGSRWLEFIYLPIFLPPPSLTGVTGMYHCACCVALVMGMQNRLFMLAWLALYLLSHFLSLLVWQTHYFTCIILEFILLSLIYNWRHWGTVINRIRWW